MNSDAAGRARVQTPIAALSFAQLAVLASGAMVTPAEQLQLAADENPRVALVLADNQRITPEAQRVLIRRSSIEVLRALAENPALLPSLQPQLANHTDLGVLHRLAGNPALLPKLQPAIAENHDVLVVRHLASNRALIKDLHPILARHHDDEVILNLLATHTLNPELLSHLVSHPNIRVAKVAVQKLDNPADAAICVPASGSRGTISPSRNPGLVAELNNQSERYEVRWHRLPWTPRTPERTNYPQVLAWRGAGVDRWSVIAERTLLGGEIDDMPVYGEFVLPEAVDGMVSLCATKTDEVFIEGAVLIHGWAQPRVWSIRGVKQSQVNLDGLPDIRATYASPLTHRGNSSDPGVPAGLAGTLLASRGTYALWTGPEGQPIGWTREENAATIPHHRQLMAGDLIGGWETTVIREAEQLIRKLAMKGREL
jgi:hypothetical protein